MSEEKAPIIQKLLKRMEATPGFAGLGASIQTISKLGDEDGDGKEIATAVLRDAALTARLLRVANSSQRGGRNVVTVDQAIAILGLTTVKSVAMSLALLESLSNRPQSKILHAEIVVAYFCGSLSFEITRLYGPRFNPPVAQICGLLQNVGRMMAIYHLFEDIERARELQFEKNIPEEAAVQQTFGVSFAEISRAVATNWNLPDVLQRGLSGGVGKAPPRAIGDMMSWQQHCGVFVSRVGDAAFRLPESREKIEVAQSIDFFQTALGLNKKETTELIAKVLDETDQLLSSTGFPCSVQEARTVLRKGSERVLDVLSAGDKLTKKMDADGGTPLEIIQRTLRACHEHFNFSRTLLCVPQGSSSLVAIAGVGRNANAVVPKFRCASAQPDIFRMALAKRVNVVVHDTLSPTYAKVIPQWHAEYVGSRAFIAVPLTYEEQVIGMLYGDYDEPLSSDMLKESSAKLSLWQWELVRAMRPGSGKNRES